METITLAKKEIETILDALYTAYEHQTELANESTDNKKEKKQYRAEAKVYHDLREKLSKRV